MSSCILFGSQQRNYANHYKKFYGWPSHLTHFILVFSIELYSKEAHVSFSIIYNKEIPLAAQGLVVFTFDLYYICF